MQAFTGGNDLKDKDNTPPDQRILLSKQGRSIHKLYSIVKEQTFFIAKSNNSDFWRPNHLMIESPKVFTDGGSYK